MNKNRKTVDASRIKFLAEEGVALTWSEEGFTEWIKSRGGNTLADAFRLGCLDFASRILHTTGESVDVNLKRED